ncbi:hypothetical protein [Allostreptomyces psammosilenae]|uniref:NhaP-type Na+/H+ and K+/H+ antiporter n=1 Tax=Allostreptomyces psammosilenae TaxID=1892865 RepID=A0A852ZPT0_9ACTN|nr:hypothetical protein [Allostreptomyces psammosilenae]NYI03497.1 NhaP-type Na+/H+ and K+/H+ antiporter [Allostreptomyces psammosilenae]
MFSGLVFIMATVPLATVLGFLLTAAGLRMTWRGDDNAKLGFVLYFVISMSLFVFSLARAPSEGNLLVAMVRSVVGFLGPL